MLFLSADRLGVGPFLLVGNPSKVELSSSGKSPRPPKWATVRRAHSVTASLSRGRAGRGLHVHFRHRGGVEGGRGGNAHGSRSGEGHLHHACQVARRVMASNAPGPDHPQPARNRHRLPGRCAVPSPARRRPGLRTARDGVRGARQPQLAALLANSDAGRMAKKPRPPRAFTIGEAARLLGVSPPALREWDQSGIFKPALRMMGSRHRRYSLRQIEAELGRELSRAELNKALRR